MCVVGVFLWVSSGQPCQFPPPVSSVFLLLFPVAFQFVQNFPLFSLSGIITLACFCCLVPWISALFYQCSSFCFFVFFYLPWWSFLLKSNTLTFSISRPNQLHWPPVIDRWNDVLVKILAFFTAGACGYFSYDQSTNQSIKYSCKVWMQSGRGYASVYRVMCSLLGAVPCLQFN